MSPGVATPCPAAPPIPIAKVCFITPSLAESRPIHEARAVGRAQVKVCKSVRETPPPNDQLALSGSRSIHPILPYVPLNLGFGGLHVPAPAVVHHVNYQPLISPEVVRLLTGQLFQEPCPRRLRLHAGV